MKLYVGNLPFSATESELGEVFGEFGDVGEISLITDRETGRPRGFGFVEMTNDDEAREAIRALDGKEMGGRQLKVNEARAKTERSGGSRDRW